MRSSLLHVLSPARVRAAPVSLAQASPLNSEPPACSAVGTFSDRPGTVPAGATERARCSCNSNFSSSNHARRSTLSRTSARSSCACGLATAAAAAPATGVTAGCLACTLRRLRCLCTRLYVARPECSLEMSRAPWQRFVLQQCWASAHLLRQTLGVAGNPACMHAVGSWDGCVMTSVVSWKRRYCHALQWLDVFHDASLHKTRYASLPAGLTTTQASPERLGTASQSLGCERAAGLAPTSGCAHSMQTAPPLHHNRHPGLPAGARST